MSVTPKRHWFTQHSIWINRHFFRGLQNETLCSVAYARKLKGKFLSSSIVSLLDNMIGQGHCEKAYTHFNDNQWGKL